MNDFFKTQDADFFDYAPKIKLEPGAINEVPEPYIRLEKANRLLLERGRQLYGRNDCRWWDDHHPDDDDLYQQAQVITQGPVNRTGLLILMEPFEEDSAEKIVAEMAVAHDTATGIGRMPGLFERARKLVNKR